MRLARLNDAPEIFHSIQGEGFSQGIPCVFVRLALCNLACAWCDTAYSWNGSREPVELNSEVIAAMISKFPCRRLVVTGGEPLVQQKELAILFALLPDFAIEMETNGTIIPDPAIVEAVSQYNISPKLFHSGNDGERAICKDVLAWFAHKCGDKSWFKFVVETEGDLVAVRQLMVDCRILQNRVILMPQAQTKSKLESARMSVVELCIKHNFRFSDRLHMTLWGERQGV